jgi:LPPG:FO 2-phospho-L-lactate transferase
VKKIVALAGGVGAAKLLRGLVHIISHRKLLIVGNTGDDFELYGLHISPDLDIVMYTLAGIVDEKKGWGIKNDTFNALQMLGNMGFETWFKIGDQDLATHVARTKMLKEGMNMSQTTNQLLKMLKVKVKLTPMTNQDVRTKIVSDGRILNFQEYFIKNQTRNTVTNVIYENADRARPAPGILKAINQADHLIICPSNPILSIGPILSVPKIHHAIKKTKAKVIAISPIIAGKTIKGPADRIMTSMGYEASAEGVAEYYKSIIDEIIIDKLDAHQSNCIERLGIHTIVTNTLMTTLEEAIKLAKIAVELD